MTIYEMYQQRINYQIESAREALNRGDDASEHLAAIDNLVKARDDLTVFTAALETGD